MHGINGWYVGPAPNHYRCMTCHIPSTHKERISDTIQVIPHLIPIPNSTIESTLKETTDKLVRYLDAKHSLLDAEPNDTTEAF